MDLEVKDSLSSIQVSKITDGDNYQAGRDIHITIGDQKKSSTKSWFEKWQTWLAFAAALLTIISVAITLLSDASSSEPEAGEKIIEQSLSGTISDDNNRPLAGVIVYLANPKDKNDDTISDTTDVFGYYLLTARASPQLEVKLVAVREGFESWDQYVHSRQPV